MKKIFKCINCGFEKENEESCNCPKCGYIMFASPYEKNEILKDEIRKFYKECRFNELEVQDLFFKNLYEDQNRFPSYYEISKFVCNSNTAEAFFFRLEKSIENIKKYINADFYNNYDCNQENLIERISKIDEILFKGLKIVNINEEIKKIEIPNIKLEYSETRNSSLIEIANELCEKLNYFSKKINRFVKLNNIYGNGFKKIYRDFTFNKKDKDEDIIRKALNEVDTKINKEFVLDIDSDGEKELHEMTKSIWKGIWVLMELPILNREFKYIFSDGTFCVNDEINNKLNEYVNNRFINIDSIINSEDFLKEKNVIELFKIYNKLIAIDEYRILRLKNKKLNFSLNEDSIITGEEKLNKLIGLSSIKDSILKIKAYVNANKKSNDLNLHMCFYGNPGTGKTEVARIMAQILYENKILPKNHLVETDRSGLVGEYVGETPQKTMNVINSAMGGVLFIDEAYSLVQGNGFDYGHEAISTLIKAMEDKRGKFCVILAGYKNELEQMIATNPGFSSRIQFKLDFPNYSRDELRSITNLMLNKKGYTITEESLNRILDITDVKRKETNFANAREIRNILDQVIMCQNVRTMSADDKEIDIADVNKYIADVNLLLPINKDNNHIKTAEEELNDLIGLDSIKKTIKKINAYVKNNANSPDFNMHMCFYGNPGTGKTEVARIVSRLLYDAGILKEAKLVETDSFGLIGRYEGETPQKTKDKINEAMNGVLFIDEAYSLSMNNQTGPNYGDEAIAVLLKEMEDKRGRFCTILAGYKNEMKQMVSCNPGFQSRIQFTLDFPDYTREELSDIARLMLKKKEYAIEENALASILDITDYERNKPNYSNARSLRNILDQVILNQNLRIESENIKNRLIQFIDVKEYIEDNGLETVLNKDKENSISFDATKLKDLYFEFNRDISNEYIEESVISISDENSEGTGFIISDDGLCLTCAHCIADDITTQKARVSMLLASGKMINTYTDFKPVRIDQDNDIALIKLNNDIEYSFLPLSSSNYKYEPLNEFITAGYPFGGERYSAISFTEGRIASVNIVEGRKTIFADMFGKPGSSGSPIMDKISKRVIGIYWGGISSPDRRGMIQCFTPIEIIWNLLK